MAKQNMLAVDIGGSSIKVVELSKSGKKIQIEHAIIEPMPKGAWKDGLPVEIDTCAVAIAKAIKSSGSNLKLAAVSVPSAAAMTRVLPVPARLADDDVEATLEAGIAQYLPFSAEEVQFDFQPLGPTMGEPDSKDVLMVAIQKDYVNMREVCFEAAGSKVELVDVDAYAVANILKMYEPLDNYSSHQAIALLEVAFDRTGLHILHGDGSIYAREQPFGGERLSEIIADNMGLSFDQAEQRKKTGNWQDATMQQAAQIFLQELSEQAVNAMQIYQSNNPRIEIQKVVVFGSGARVPGVEQFLSSHLKMVVDTIDPSVLFGVGKRCKLAASDMPSLAIACGLALRNFV